MIKTHKHKGFSAGSFHSTTFVARDADEYRWLNIFFLFKKELTEEEKAGALALYQYDTQQQVTHEDWDELGVMEDENGEDVYGYIVNVEAPKQINHSPMNGCFSKMEEIYMMGRPSQQ